MAPRATAPDGRLRAVLRHPRAAEERRRAARRLRALLAKRSAIRPRSRTACSPAERTDRRGGVARAARAAAAARASSRHLGYVDPARPPGAVSKARGCWCSRRSRKGSGMPVLEAMTVGVPVVAANRGALPEVLGDAGLLVDPDDPDAIAGAIARAAGRRRVRERVRGARRLPRRGVQLAGYGAARLRLYTRRAHRTPAAMRDRHRRARAVRPRRPASAATSPGCCANGPTDAHARQHDFVLVCAGRHRRADRHPPVPRTRLVRQDRARGGSRCGCRAAAARDGLDVFFAPAYTAPLRAANPAGRRRSTISRSSRTRSGSVWRKAPAGG